MHILYIEVLPISSAMPLLKVRMARYDPVVIAVVGEYGSGKSTLINNLTNVEQELTCLQFFSHQKNRVYRNKNKKRCNFENMTLLD